MVIRIILMLVIIASSFILGMCVGFLKNMSTVEQLEKRLEPTDRPSSMIYDVADLKRYTVDTIVPDEYFRSEGSQDQVSNYIASSISKQLEPLILKTVVSEMDVLTNKVRYRFDLWIK